MMQSLAETFVHGATLQGFSIDWTSASALQLDLYCDAFMAGELSPTSRWTGRPTKDYIHTMVMSMGAYLGELLVRNGGGRWAYDIEQNNACVDLDNDLRIWPHNKVFKRLTIGPEHSLAPYYHYGLTQEVLDGSIAREWTDDTKPS
ncbi:hypothetical protein ACFWY5_13075 [Nonomuraea sp. NPDC059007]|uniref:hypothetical protein n=1 Tax=Nonomuraea sp. NPDC059007 TaxID=3346692 RepID=UPI0036C0727B